MDLRGEGAGKLLMGWQETQRKLSSLSFVLGNSKQFLVVVRVK